MRKFFCPFLLILGTLLPVLALPVLGQSPVRNEPPVFRALAFYSTHVERDHVDFAFDAIRFYDSLAKAAHFIFDTTSDWGKHNDTDLARYQVVIWLNEFPQNEVQRTAFRRYMERGGAWLGFHVSAYNDKYSHWPWFVEFLGGGVFYTNNWPPLRARLTVDDRKHPVTKGLPADFVAPINEWYIWEPSPRLNKDVKVLVTLDSSNYPLGKKDLILKGDLPVVWTNTKYRMLYMNMGHGDQIFTSSVQNRLIANGLLWLGSKK